MKISFLFLFISSLLSAQIKEDFTDGNFTIDPVWQGDMTHFIVNTASQLQLHHTASDTSCLYTQNFSALLRNTQWNFFIKQAFSPSANNYGRVYLASDQKNLNGSLNGYYLQFGEAGSNDAIELYRQSGKTHVSIARGTNGKIAGAFALGIKVTCDTAGNWQVYVDAKGGTAYLPEASGKDTVHTVSGYFGVFAVYTISNATKFYFDDFYNGPVIHDTLAPAIASLTVTSKTKVDVLYTEAVDSITSQTPGNYFANNGIGAPSVAQRDSSDFKLVHLIFAAPFKSEAVNTLTIKNVADLHGNAMSTAVSPFQYYDVKTFDVVINEIMADPEPVLNTLPAFEYVELYNKTAFPVLLTGWQFTVGSTQRLLPAIVMPAKGFLILTSATAAPYFPKPLNVLTINNFPALNNTGQLLVLKNAENAVISAVAYTDEWYGDVAKKEGGWSLEQIDPHNPCGETGNWCAAADKNGGTPGLPNSVYKINPDVAPPALLRANITATHTIQLFFNESLDSTTLSNPFSYSVDNAIGNPILVKATAPDFKSITLTFSAAFQKAVVYTIKINNPITDCAGNLLGTGTVLKFAIPDSASENDLVINEILFNPKTGGVDFVELYNRSEKIIDLKTIRLSQYDTLTNAVINIEKITAIPFLFYPRQYLVLSENENLVKNHYQTLNPNGFLNMPHLPPMYTDEGTVCLSTATAIIDQCYYSEKMHFALLNDTKGVSLERIDFNRPAKDPTNWHSASKSTGYATPAYQNSQYNTNSDAGQEVEVVPQLFSPDEDGYHDLVTISYHFSQPGYLGNISIYDSRGRLVKLLVRNELLGTKGAFSWDGINEYGEKGHLGIYIIYFEVIDLSGDKKQYKKTCVLAGKI